MELHEMIIDIILSYFNVFATIILAAGSPTWQVQAGFRSKFALVQ